MPIRIVIADDHTVVRDGLRYVLEAQPGMAVVGVAANGREAVQRVQELNPDVVIMDIAMPELNGIEATAQICAAASPAAVLILSMFATSEHIYRALQAGARGYLVKESAIDEVVEAVRVVHGGRRYLSHKITEEVLDDYIRQRRASETGSPIESLSGREREVLQLVVEGKSSAEIAEMIHLSPKTVETYRSRMMAKLGVNDVAGLVKFAIQHGLTALER